MQRRQFLAGTAASLPLLTGCMSLLGGGSVIDASNLSTYTSDKFSYSVKYPSEWSKNGVGTFVQFEGKNEDGETTGAMFVQAIPAAFTRDEYMDKMKQIFKESSKEFSTSDEEEIDLPNDHTGKAVTMSIKVPSEGDGGLLSGGSLDHIKGRAVFASGGTYLYTVMVFVPEDDYGATESAIKEILKSLTIGK